MSAPPNTRWMSSPPPVYDSRSSPYHYTTLTPYLRLPHLLSLTWLAYPILSLLFVAFRLQLSQASAQDAATNAKADLLASCLAAEKAATSAASMPRFLAVTTNAQISDAVNGTMNAARATLVLALTIMEVIINFIVDIYRSTFLCFLELVVRGGLSILIGAVQEFNNFIENTLSGLRTSIQNDVAGANSAIQSAVSAINKVNPFSDITVPQFSIPSLNALQNITLPTDFEDSLIKLNNTLPSISDLKDKVESIIDTPFELLKKDINDTFAGLSFDASTLPVPQQNTVSFCGDMDTSVVDDLGRDLVKICKIGTIILIFVALLLLAGNCALEWYKWRCLERHFQYTREAWTSDPTLFHGGSKSAPTIDLSDHNLLMLQASSQHPLLTKIANRSTALLRLSPSQHIHLQWFFHYVFHPPALACFLIGFFGLLSVQIQLLAISPLTHKYSAQAAASVNDFSNTIATSINSSMYNQSAAYANDVNGRVDHIQSTVNDGLFGWVNVTTTTLNDTINTFYTDIQDAVNTVFNGTILDDPVQEFLRCFIGSKVDAIESALTFLHDNLQIDIPRVNDTVLVLSPDQVNEATRPIAAAAIGSGDSGDDQGLVGRLVATYVTSLKKERIMFGIFMGLWGVVVLMALGVIFWHSYGRDWVEAYKKRKWQKEQRNGLQGFVVPFRDGGAGYNNSDVPGGFGDTEKASVDLPSFAPIVSPKPGFFNHLRSYSLQSQDTLKPPHPLNSRNPEFGKSWDSFLDQANSTNTAPVTGSKLKISSPRKLMAISRMGRERFIREDEKGSSVHDEDNGKKEVPSWLKRVTNVFRKPAEEKSSTEPELTSERIRPQLTISTSHASESNLPAIDRNSFADVAPPSAWSVSPGPRPPSKLPWMQTIVPTKKSTIPSLSSFQPKSRRTASVPLDVDSVRDSLQVEAAPESEQQFAVPLHHGFERPVPPATRSFTPPPVHPTIYAQKYPNLQAPPAVQMPLPNLSGPITRTLTTTHSRNPSQAVDPFVTPFDDENRVIASTTSPVDHSFSVRKSTPTNPFIAMAI